MPKFLEVRGTMRAGSPKTRTLREHGCGFTLIELLVVVAVLTALLAILLPAIMKARDLAARTACRSNLRQLGAAWYMYLDDYGGKFYRRRENADFIFGGWKGRYYPNEERVLNGYLDLDPSPVSKEKAKIFRCPGDKGYTGPVFYEDLGNSYQTNILLVGQEQIGHPPDSELRVAINEKMTGLTRQAVDNHSRVILIGDYAWVYQWLPEDREDPTFFHQRRCCYNVAFLDGHVEFLKIRKGLYVTDEYTVLPSKKLYGLAYEVQEEVP
jgi:prepilin-type N-terminal cleavage/methylation domain-containing protein/prepilin-type processing-associated H-X9-DG protein